MKPRVLWVAASLLFFVLPGPVYSQTKAAMILPVPDAVLSGSTQNFSWDAGTGALEYLLNVGNVPGGKNYFGKGTGKSRSVTVKGLPVNGAAVYVRLWTRLASGWTYDDYAYKAATPKVLLFLHGMNSSPSAAWDSVRSPFKLGTIPVIRNGVCKSAATQDANGRAIYAYAVGFGAYDVTSGRKGLEGISGAGNYATSGDFETFDQLGAEVDSAVTCVRKLHPGASIILVAHSRGGLAGRAFLQSGARTENQSAIIGFVTTGSPHQGSPLGRIYTWLEANPRNKNSPSNDWVVADKIAGSIDVRRPTIGDLADVDFNRSPGADGPVADLNKGAGNLPGQVSYYGIAYHGYSLGKLQSNYDVFAGGVFYKIYRIPPITPACREFILGTGRTTYDFTGDGIVPSASQFFLDKAGVQYNRNVLHTDETRQFADLLNGIKSVSNWYN